MKEFSKKIFSQKSLAMLFAMFMLSACDLAETDSVDSDWKALVGGQTVYVNGALSGSFSSDASSFSFYSTEDGAFNLPIKTSSSNGATYEFSAGVMTYVFSSVTSTGGYLSINDESAVDFTFTASN